MSNYYYSLGISPEELGTLKEAFQIYDAKQLGYITDIQFIDILSNLGITTDKTQLLAIVKAVDLNNDHKIDFHEFVLAMFRYLPHEQETNQIYRPDHVFNEKDSDEELMDCFKFFDKDCDGRISPKELQDVMTRFGVSLSSQEIKEMMCIADTNRDGFVDFDEFKQLLPPL